MLTRSRKDVKAIFDPLVNDIERLVDDQINLFLVNRLSEGHPKAEEIKVCPNQIKAKFYN